MLLKLQFLIVGSLMFLNIAYGQGLVIKDSVLIDSHEDTILNIGIYRTFEEFKYNNPSLELNYKIETSKCNGCEITSDKAFFFKLLTDKPVPNDIRKAFGFCDGQNIYIRAFTLLPVSRNRFVKILYLGRYSYFEDMATAFTGFSVMKYRNELVIDIETGKRISLDRSKLRKLMADDPELIEKMDSESHIDVKEYIITYQERKKQSDLPGLNELPWE